jgi:hypothetical protein
LPYSGCPHRQYRATIRGGALAGAEIGTSAETGAGSFAKQMPAAPFRQFVHRPQGIIPISSS